MEPEMIENFDGTWTVMVGEEIISRGNTHDEAKEYIAAMMRGDC